MKRNGLTLIELLVVVSIIGVLTSLLLPALQRGREKARQILCMGNLRSLNMAFVNYYDTYDGYVPLSYNSANPTNNSWYVTINYQNDFFGKSWNRLAVYHCPVSSQAPSYWIGYAKTACISGYIWAKIAAITKASSTVNVADVGDSNSTLGQGAVYDYHILQIGEDGQTGYRHFGGASVLLFDGHSEWCKARIPDSLFIP